MNDNSDLIVSLSFKYSGEVCYPLLSLGDQLAHGKYMVHSTNYCLEAIIKDLSHSTARA